MREQQKALMQIRIPKKRNLTEVQEDDSDVQEDDVTRESKTKRQRLEIDDEMTQEQSNQLKQSIENAKNLPIAKHRA